MTSSSRPVNSIDDFFGWLMQVFELAVLTLLFLALVIVGLIEVFLVRRLDIFLSWPGDAMTVLLLWLIMAGSMVATGRLRHFRISLVDGILPECWRVALYRLVFFFSAMVCLLLSWLGLQIVGLEHEFGQLAFAGMPNWIALAPVPFVFAIMGARFAAWALVPPNPADVSTEQAG